MLPLYLNDGGAQEAQWQNSNESGTLQRVTLRNSEKEVVHTAGYKEALDVHIDFTARRADSDYVLAVRVIDEMGRDLLTSWDLDSSNRTTSIGKQYTAECQLPRGLLRPGRYYLMVMCRNSQHNYLEDIEEATIVFEVTNQDFPMQEGRFGVVLPTLNWRHKQL